MDFLSNILIWFYERLAFQDLGIAIVEFTILVRLILLPLFYKSFKNQAIMQKLQPEVRRLQTLHKNDKEKQARALMTLYREHKVNPLTNFLLILVQLPILIALYRLFLGDFPGLNHQFLGLIDLKERSIILTGLAAFFQYWQGYLSQSGMTADKEQKQIMQAMIWIGPLLTLLILSTLPAALGLYWLTTTVFSIGQQIYINKKIADLNYGADKNHSAKSSPTD